MWSYSSESSHLAASVAWPRPYYSSEVRSSRTIWVCFLSVDQVLLFSSDGGHQATKSQRSDCWSGHPCQSLRPWRRMKSCSFSIGSFVSQCSFFVLEGHRIQSAECLSFRGAERTAFILLSLWPYIKAVESKGSTMGKRPGRDITWKWLHSGCTVVCFLLKLMDQRYVFVLTVGSLFLWISCYIT